MDELSRHCEINGHKPVREYFQHPSGATQVTDRCTECISEETYWYIPKGLKVEPVYANLGKVVEYKSE